MRRSWRSRLNAGEAGSRRYSEVQVVKAQADRVAAATDEKPEKTLRCAAGLAYPLRSALMRAKD